MATIDKLKSAFTTSLGLEPGSTGIESLAYGQTDGWDSVAHMSLVAEIENAFDIMLSTDDVIDLSSFTKARDIVAKYGVDLQA
jgi:acyl carrier protein